MIEKRATPKAPEVRAEGEGESQEKYIEGIAAKVNESANIMGIFEEIIAPGAFDDVLNDDARCLLNHDENKVIARVKPGSLELFLDDAGNLNYRAKISENRQSALDAYDMIQSGDIDQSSFAFRVKEEEWTFVDDDDKPDKRTIKKIEMIRDVSPVTYPAYQETTVEAVQQQRNEARKAQEPEKTESELSFYQYKLRKLKLQQ